MNLGAYRLDRELTRSPVSALHGTRDGAAVVKVFDPQPGLSPAEVREMRAEFLRQARELLRLDHPHLPRVLEADLQAAQPWVAVAAVPGARRLGAALAQLAPAELARVVEALARGLAHAHAQSVVHGLVSSERVLIGSDRQPVLTGFGRGLRLLAARQRREPLAGLELLLTGAPELLGGLAPEPRSDVYGLGLILYEGLCGRDPYRSNTPISVQQRLTCPPPRPSTFQPGVDPGLEAIAMRCLELTPAARYGSAAAVAEALVAWRQRTGSRIGPYRLEAELGRGGMSRVWRAVDGQGRVVALKLRAAGANPRRFQREAALHSRLEHAHLVRVVDHGQHEDQEWLAMELVAGRTLEELIRSAPLTPRFAARVLAQVARGLHHAHQRGVVHRDVKPANVLVRASDRAALLADFGLAKPLAPDDSPELGELTRRHMAIGTPAFAAPEQLLDGAQVGVAADVFGVGQTLWAALTGRAAFERGSLSATLQATLHDPLPSLRALRPDVPPLLEAICRRCLARDPLQRYPDAATLADDLEAVAAGQG